MKPKHVKQQEARARKEKHLAQHVEDFVARAKLIAEWREDKPNPEPTQFSTERWRELNQGAFAERNVLARVSGLQLLKLSNELALSREYLDHEVFKAAMHLDVETQRITRTVLDQLRWGSEEYNRMTEDEQWVYFRKQVY